MKNIFYSILVLSLSFHLSATAYAQGIYQLWGTTFNGGTDDTGVLFRANGEGNNAQNMYSFTSTNKGNKPSTQLTAYNGKFYSITYEGGTNNLGVIFEWDPVSNIYTKKYDFENADGNLPRGSLVLRGGKFYGMAQFGGSNNLGTIFEWDPVTNIYLKKHDFDGITGSGPYGSLVLHEGKFYGMTHRGGSYDLGVIFEWDPVANTYLKKYDFDGVNGSNPYGDLAFHNGKFYGMTSLGGGEISNSEGVIFEWDPSTNTYTKKFTFLYGFGDYPGHTHNGNLLLVNGKFYGMTTWGGSNYKGLIFEWDPSTNTYATRFEFGSSSSIETFGANPFGNLSFKQGKFYGMALRGGSANGGVIFEWDPVTSIYSKKYDFEGSTGFAPFGSLLLNERKFYGMTAIGGAGESGVIFEWDPEGTGAYTKKIDFNVANNGKFPGSLVYQGGNLYGTAYGGLNGLGVIFEWDLVSDKFIKKHDFSPAPGNRRNRPDLTFCNGKFYGICSYNSGVPLSFNQHIFEWEPVTNVFKYYSIPTNNSIVGNMVESSGKLYGLLKGQGLSGEIFEWDTTTKLFKRLYGLLGTDPVGGIVESGGKLYGLTNRGGTNNAGMIFEWNISTNTFTKRHDFDHRPLGRLVPHEGKFYGITPAVIFEWDPVGFVYTKKFEFSTRTEFGYPNGNAVFINGKMYGTTVTGGINNNGAIFEWSPLTNIYSTKSRFTGSNGKYPDHLTVVPALATRSVSNSCINYSPVVIDNSNNNSWVPIIDDDGYAVAEIKANGNNLGIVNATLFVNNNPIREDEVRRLYLDRNITITPRFQPSSPVDIRLYIRGAELTTIKNATNSDGLPSGITTINDLSIFKNDDNCESSIIKKAKPVATIGAKWETDYVLSASITKFSTFYFASKDFTALPLTLLKFSGRWQNGNALLNWKTENELNTSEFIVERSIDGNQYKAVGAVAAANRAGIHEYSFTDPGINMIGVKIIYYRLQQKDIDGQFVYSKIVTLSPGNENTIVGLYPNPVNKQLTLIVHSAQRDNIQLKIIDASGRIIKDQTRQLTTGSNSFTIDVSKLATGVYYLSMQGNVVNKWMQFVKQ